MTTAATVSKKVIPFEDIAFKATVLHNRPDLECGVMDWLARRDRIRQVFSLPVGAPRKFIDAGPLRREDWPGASVISAEVLEEAGNLFLDCGGGTFDQHGRYENAHENTTVSLDLQLDHLRSLGLPLYGDILPVQMIAIFKRIIDNDRAGDAVAVDHEMKSSETPHTQRHIRNIDVGLNELHPDDPNRVVEWVNAAFDGIVAHCRADEDASEQPLDPEKVNKYLLLDGLIHGVRLAYGADLAAAFERDARDALLHLERNFVEAERDFWSDRCKGGRITPLGTGRELVVVIGESDSPDFGKVARLGNVAPAHGRNAGKLRVPSRPRCAKADIVVQFWSDGRFLVSSSNNGFPLNRVAGAVRYADLLSKGIDVPLTQQSCLMQSGHLRFNDEKGEPVEAIYLAEFLTAFGNGFRSNRNPSKVTLSRQLIGALIREAIRRDEALTRDDVLRVIADFATGA